MIANSKAFTMIYRVHCAISEALIQELEIFLCKLVSLKRFLKIGEIMLFYILLMLCLHMGMLFSAAIKPPISALSINTSSSSTEEKPRFEKSRLSAIALLQQVGYKTANLHELERFCTYFNNARYSYQVKIPSFCGISSHVIKKLLLEQGFDVATRWGDVVKHLISLGDGDGTEADDERGSIEFDMTLKFSAEFLEAQKIFERDLSEALDKLIVHIGAGDHSLGTMFENDKLDNLLKMASDVHEKMMVRSSGQEDSIDVSNAGGNVSVANVVAEKQVILKAMKEVILSYFGMKSLTQRLSLNDQTLLKSDVLMPVLIQKMIGEKRDSEIPRCGVMFSTDPEVRCKGISIIQSAYGHNEGVVNSLIPVDTYYAMRLPNEKMTFYPIIREKRQRLVPSETAAMLERQSNHKKLAENSSLNETELTILATFGQELEDYYGYGVDIEFVIKDKTIYIVQARPITHKNDTPSPSYVSASPRNVRSYSAATISSAGGSTRRLSPDSLLICTDTIGIALETYLSPAFDRVSVVAGVIGTMAPSLSHEVTIFRGKGKPIVFIKEWNEVSEALQAGQYGFLDVQQNQLLFIDAHSADEVEVKEGWINYPMPRQLSLLTSFFTTTDVSIEGGLAGRGRVSIKPWKELLDIMKKGAQPAVIEAAAQFCAQLEGMIKNNKKLLEFDQNLTAQAELIQSVAMRLCKQIVECSIYDASHEKYMHRLLVIRALESLLYQQFEQGIMQQHSIAMLHKIFSQEKYAKQLTPSEITFASEEVKNLYIQLVKIAGIAFSDAIKYLWLDFIKEAAQKSPSSLQDLAQLIKKLSSFNLLPIWVHTIFPQSILADLFEFNESFIQECITKWQLAFNRDNVFLDELKAIQHRIESINISVFGDQKRVGIAWNDFNEKILGLILRPAFFDSF
ncbi:hypothetical protein FJ364_00825, partial [Candidatus Dependentiae bacterium]|nr:hypothetical protein [Candidatus Dependentiae bacterium]